MAAVGQGDSAVEPEQVRLVGVLVLDLDHDVVQRPQQRLRDAVEGVLDQLLEPRPGHLDHAVHRARAADAAGRASLAWSGDRPQAAARRPGPGPGLPADPRRGRVARRRTARRRRRPPRRGRPRPTRCGPSRRRSGDAVAQGRRGRAAGAAAPCPPAGRRGQGRRGGRRRPRTRRCGRRTSPCRTWSSDGVPARRRGRLRHPRARSAPRRASTAPRDHVEIGAAPATPSTPSAAPRSAAPGSTS